MKAGFSKMVITPEPGIRMAGHPGTKYALRVRDDLFVRAAAIREKGETVVFAGLDVLFVEIESVNYIREAVCKKTGIKYDSIFISATHTHSGPMTTGLFGKEQEAGYIEYLHSRTIEAIINAVNNMSPCKIGFGETAVKGFAFNARMIMASGRIETHPFKYDKTIVGPEGPVDDTLSFLYFYDEEANLYGGIINYANHPQIMERQEPSISADFPGEIEKYILADRNKEAVVLFLNGTCGNLCPVNAMDSSKREVGERWLVHMGSELGKQANVLLNNKTETAKPRLACICGEVELTIRDIPEETLAQAREFLKHHHEEDTLQVSNYGVEEEGSPFLSLEEYLGTNEWLLQQYTDVLELYKIRQKHSTEKIMITALDLCGIGIVMLPFEVFVELGLEIKERSPYEHTIIAELTNGSYGYIPTEKAFQREGGYETITLRSSRFRPESAGLLVEKALGLLKELYGRKINNVDTQYKI
jgi:hypothetical protein